MFFRRQKPHVATADERIEKLRRAGFGVEQTGGVVRAERDTCACLIEDIGGAAPRVTRAGVVVGGEIAALVHAGYQMFLCAPDGKRVPALAGHLTALHEFEEALREALGLTRLYNLSLGTTCDDHLYDRVESRDQGVPRRAWER